MSDWADEKAAETLKLILSPAVTLDQAVEFIAATFRLVEAQGAGRGIDDLSARLRHRTPEDIQNEFEGKTGKT